MKENNDGNDTNVGSMENSIEEDIKIVEDFIDVALVFLPKYSTKKVEKRIDEESYISIKHILSDYKKLKEEFKAIDSECSRLERKEADMERENEELKATLRDTQNSWFEEQRDLINSNDYIAKKKIKDQLEHYQELQNNYIKKYDEINEILQAMINVLQEILEESEEKIK